MLWKRRGVKICSPYARLFFSMLGVDTCVFLIFTTRAKQKKLYRNKHPLEWNWFQFQFFSETHWETPIDSSLLLWRPIFESICRPWPLRPICHWKTPDFEFFSRLAVIVTFSFYAARGSRAAYTFWRLASRTTGKGRPLVSCLCPRVF